MTMVVLSLDESVCDVLCVGVCVQITWKEPERVHITSHNSALSLLVPQLVPALVLGRKAN